MEVTDSDKRTFYHNLDFITTVKRFTVQAHKANPIKLFSIIIHTLWSKLDRFKENIKLFLIIKWPRLQNE